MTPKLPWPRLLSLLARVPEGSEATEPNDIVEFEFEDEPIKAILLLVDVHYLL